MVVNRLAKAVGLYPEIKLKQVGYREKVTPQPSWDD